MKTAARFCSVVVALIGVTVAFSGCAVGYPYYGNGYSNGRSYGRPVGQPYYGNGGYRGGNYGYGGDGYGRHHHHDDDDD
jgi:hypothetical protein